MELWQIITLIVIPLVLAYTGYNERDKAMLKQKLNKTMIREDVKDLVELMNAPMKIEQREFKEDLHRIESKLDRVLEQMSHLNNSSS